MKVYAIISTLAALIFLDLFLWTIPIPMGGGQGDTSPNGEFVANASSLRDVKPLGLGQKDTYYEFRVTRGNTTPFKRIVLYPAEKNNGMDFRELPKIISWAPDSSEVTFTIPGATLKLDMKDHQQEQFRSIKQSCRNKTDAG